MLKGFKQFILRGNVVDLAVGVVIGAAFSNLVNALVSAFISPLIAAIIAVPDFSRLSFTVNGSTFQYGYFFNALISFLLIAAAVYFVVVLPLNALTTKMKREPEAKSTTKTCPECASPIPLAAKRCPLCTSILNENK